MLDKKVIDHVEHYLGRIDYGWKDSNSLSGITIARFREQPVEGLNTFTTLGLSDHILLMPNNREVRQELVFSALSNVLSEDIVRHLLNLVESILLNHEALLRGQVIGPTVSTISTSHMKWMYVSMPILFDEKFETFRDSVPSTVFAWIFPIFESEANYIREHGWEAFEDILETKDPDLWDLNRHSVI